MIHGLPAESAAAAIYAAKPKAEAGQNIEPAETSRIAEGKQPSVSAASSGHQLGPPESLDPKAAVKPRETGSPEEKTQQSHPEKQVMTPAEKITIEELETRDQQVRSHEQAHMSAGGRYITRGAHYTYHRGPDGIRYAVGGEVEISISPVPGDPEATIEKAESIRKAALAPAQPSAQDQRVAVKAAQMKMQARADKLLAEAAGNALTLDKTSPSDDSDSDPDKSGVDVFI